MGMTLSYAEVALPKAEKLGRSSTKWHQMGSASKAVVELVHLYILPARSWSRQGGKSVLPSQFVQDLKRSQICSLSESMRTISSLSLS